MVVATSSSSSSSSSTTTSMSRKILQPTSVNSSTSNITTTITGGRSARDKSKTTSPTTPQQPCSNDDDNDDDSTTRETTIKNTTTTASAGDKDDLQHHHVKVVIDALYTMIVHTGCTTKTSLSSSSSDGGTTDHNGTHIERTKVRTMLNLFGAATSNSHMPLSIIQQNEPFRSMKDQHQYIYNALRRHATTTTTVSLSSSQQQYSKIKDIFQSLHHLIQYVIQNYIPSPFMTNEAVDIPNDEMIIFDTNHSQQQQQQQKEGYLFLTYATHCVMAYFEGLVSCNQHTSNTDTVMDVLLIAKTLHDFIEYMNDTETTTLDDESIVDTTYQTISTLCETWWLQNGYDKESIIHNILPTLVGNAVRLDAKVSDIKRLYTLRTSLSILDFDDTESNSFVSLLLRITSSPSCITNNDGKKFIAYLLSDPEFNTTTTTTTTRSTSSIRHQIHQSIRVQIPNNKKSILLHYSDIYYMAWKEVCSNNNNTIIEELRNMFEMEILSDYIYASIYVEQPTVLQSIHIVLSKWYNMKHNNNNTSSTDHTNILQFLHRVYTPILWRATVAPNPIVRCNAVQLLVHIFSPLALLSSSSTSIDKSKKKHIHDTHVTKVYTTMQQLLHDPDIKVRCTTANVTTQLLVQYWDGIPTQYIHTLLNCIVSEHASDVTSSVVRAGAVTAITQLLNAPQSHGVLREVLPAIGNLIHDKVEKVRLAVVHMLLRIKTIPNIKYYHIVPLEHLTARFIEEAKVRHPSKSVVAAALTSLMINSYFPEKSDPTTMVGTRTNTEPIRRALQFCTDEPQAAIVFYANVSKYRSFTSIVQLLIQLFQCLYNSSVQQPDRGYDRRSKNITHERRRTTTTSKRRRRISTSNTHNDDASKDTVASKSSKGDDTDTDTISPPIEVLATISEVIRTLWESIIAKVQRNDEWNTFLMDEFSGPKLSSIFSYYDSMAYTISSSFPNKDDDEDTDNESLLIQEDCYRICSAVISCARHLPSLSVTGLVSNIFASIHRDCEAVPGCHLITQSSNIVSYIIVLLHSWNMTDQIITSLTSNIRSSLYKSFLDDENVSLLGSSMTISGDSKKRRSGRSIVSGKSKAVVDINDVDNTKLPQLPVPIIINVLDYVLTGGCDPDCISARDAILSSTDASEGLVCLFHDGVKCMEQILDQIDCRCLSASESSKMNDLVSICELHGRFTLHKEAGEIVPLLRRSGPLSSDKILPFSDLNISSIQMEKSFADTSLSSPQSPNLLCRPRRRSNRNQTPQRLDGGVGIYQDSQNDQMSVIKIQHAVAGPLFVSSCKLFTEWLLVSSFSDTADFVILAVNEWCQILSINTRRDDDNSNVADLFDSILPVFFRLICQLVLTSENCEILKEVIIKMSDDSRSIDWLVKVLSSVLIPKANPVLSIELAKSFLDVTYDSLPEESETVHFELPDSCDNDWTVPKRSLAAMLMVIMSNQQTCNDLANIMIDKFSVHVNERSHHLPAIFDVQCMWILISDTKYSKASASAVELIIKTIQHVDLTSLPNEDLKMLIEDFQSKTL